MPIIEEISDTPAEEVADLFETAIAPLEADLPIPPEFMADDYPPLDPAKQLNLKQWLFSAELHLHQLLTYLRTKPPLTDDQRARVALSAGLFRGEDAFSTSTMHMDALSSVKLTIMPAPGVRYGPAPLPLLHNILASHIRPLFAPNPHPSLSLDTGRRLPHPAGGGGAGQDMFEDQLWKARGTGVWNVLRWCCEHAAPESYDDLWPLLIPPTMTMLDDYQPIYRLKALSIVQELLQHAPAGLVRRTGIDGLLYSSLENSFSLLHTPQSPALLLSSLRTHVQLTLLTTPPSSEERFNKLSDALTKGVVNAWSFAGNEVGTMQAAAEGLEGVVRELGLGAVRFLKVIIPQLTLNLHTQPFQPPARGLQLATAQALKVVIQQCAPRVGEWKEPILAGLLRGWVEVQDVKGVKDQDTLTFQAALKELWDELLRACPTIPEVEAPQLQNLDSKMFDALVTA